LFGFLNLLDAAGRGVAPNLNFELIWQSFWSALRVALAAALVTSSKTTALYLN